MGPLQGFRVVEMAGIGPGPFCAMLLADMGAEVIRIQARSAGQAVPLLNTKYDVMARGRRSLAIDLKKSKGRDVAIALIDKADALIEGFRPGVMERLGLGPEVCRARNPRLVYGRMTGWGQSGPLAQSAGHDINYLALSGVLHAIGTPESPPPVPLNVIADMGGGGLLLAFGIVCALLETRQSGQGQVVDAAMTEGAAFLASMIYGFKAAGIWSNSRSANLLDGGAHFYGTYVCADGKYVAVGSIEPQFYALLIEKLGIDFAELGEQMEAGRWPDARARLAAAFRTRTRDEWAAMFETTDACVSPVLDWDEAIAHPHNRARNSFVEIEGVPQPAPVPRFSRTPPSVSRPPSAADQHTEAILSEWGLSQSDLVALRECEAI